MTAPAVALAPDLVAGLRRLKLARVRVIAPEVCQTAKTQRWAPDEFLRTLIEAEIAARDDFKVQASSVPQATFNYIAGLEWIRAKENLCLVGPAGTGKSHLLVGVGHAAVQAGLRVRYFTTSDLVETLYRGLADNSVGRVIDNLLRVDLVILDELGFALSTRPEASSSSASSRRPMSAAAWASPVTGPSTSGATSCPTRPPPFP